MTRSILIYANCQGEELLLTAEHLPALTGRVIVKWIPQHLVSAEDWSARYGADFMSDVAVVWEQVESGPVSENRAELHRRMPAAAQVIRFPPFSALFLWPFAGNDPRVALDPERYPWPDTVGAMLANEGDLPDDALFEKYLRITTERMPDLDRRLRMDVARWKATDALADIKVADWVEQSFRNARLFHTSGHLTALPISMMLKQLLIRTDILPSQAMEMAMGEIDQLLRYHQGQDFESVPIHPVVGERLRLRYFDPDARYRWHGHEWTFRQYILHYIRWAPYLD